MMFRNHSRSRQKRRTTERGQLHKNQPGTKSCQSSHFIDTDPGDASRTHSNDIFSTTLRSHENHVTNKGNMLSPRRQRNKVRQDTPKIDDCQRLNDSQAKGKCSSTEMGNQRQGGSKITRLCVDKKQFCDSNKHNFREKVKAHSLSGEKVSWKCDKKSTSTSTANPHFVSTGSRQKHERPWSAQPERIGKSGQTCQTMMKPERSEASKRNLQMENYQKRTRKKRRWKHKDNCEQQSSFNNATDENAVDILFIFCNFCRFY